MSKKERLEYLEKRLNDFGEYDYRYDEYMKIWDEVVELREEIE